MCANREADHEYDAKDHAHVYARGVTNLAADSTGRGVWAVKWSLFALLGTALVQAIIVALSGSRALLADTVHNFADAATALPLWVAFGCSRLKPSPRFAYGYGRVEDLAGLTIMLTILASAVVVGYQSVLQLLSPQPLEYLWAVAVGSVVGFLGNEAVARFQIKVGREIKSAALVANGLHARADGLTSLTVLVGAAGVWLGYPLADPLIGLLITLVILRLVWQSARAVLTRMLDGVEPGVLEAVEAAARQAAGVSEVAGVRARWVGHRIHLELNIAVNPALSVSEGHGIAKEVRHQVLHELAHVSRVTVHIDPSTEAGERFHLMEAHAHDGLPTHSHV
jgi:cation diffusion facilitator family transporter